MGNKKEPTTVRKRKRPHPLLAFFVYLVIGTLPVGGCIGIMAAPEAAAAPFLVIVIVAVVAGAGWIVLNFREVMVWLWRHMR